MEPVDIYKRDGKVILPHWFVVIIATLFPLGDCIKEAGDQETKLVGEGEEDYQTPPPDL